MTDVSGNTTSQYAVIAPISVSTDISPSRQTRESSNKFLQEHTIISELKKKDRVTGKLKYVDVEFNNVATEQRAETTKKEGPRNNMNYEDWTVPRARPRKQPPPPPPTKPKSVSKAKSLAQIVVPVDTAISGETVKTKARCASESDTVEDEQHQQNQPQVQYPVNSLRRPSRKAPPPPKQLHPVQNDKESVAVTRQKAKSPKPLHGNIGSDKDTTDLPPPSPKQRRAFSSEKEIVEEGSLESNKVKRTSSFKEAKALRPVRKAPPPPNKSTEYINVVKDDDDATFSTFFVSHKKAQSMSYENVVCDDIATSSPSTMPQSQAYENVKKGRRVHNSDEGRHRGSNNSYENVESTRQAIENKLNKHKSASVDMNLVDTSSHQQVTPNGNGGISYQKHTNKRKSVKKRPNISPPHSPPPPPPEPPGRFPMSPPEATSELTAASSSPPCSKKLNRPSAPPPPPPGKSRVSSTPPPRPPPPPDEMEPPNFTPPPPPGVMQPPDFSPPPPPGVTEPPNFTPPPPPGVTQPPNFTPPPPPRPPPPVEETDPEPLTAEHLMSTRQHDTIPPHVERTSLKLSNNALSQVENSVTPPGIKGDEQVFTTGPKTKPFSPPLIMAKKPFTLPPASPPPPPPSSSSLSPTMVLPEMSSDQKRVSFESAGVGSPSISTSSEASFYGQQVIRQQHNGDVDKNDLHIDIITNYTASADFFGQPSRELDPITEYADTESSGSVYIARTVSEEVLDWNSDQQLSADNSPDLKRLGGDSTPESASKKKIKSPLVEMSTTATENGVSFDSQEANHRTDDGRNINDTVEQLSPDDSSLSKESKKSGANPFWYRESMIMAVGRGNALHGYPSKKRPVPPPRGPVSPPVIENMNSSPARIGRPPDNTEVTEDMENSEVEISLAYTDSTSSRSSSGPCPIPLPRNNKDTKSSPPAAPPRDRSSLSSSPARNPERSRAAFSRVRAASFLTVSAGKELNTVTVVYMGSKQVDQYVGQINNIARDLSEKQASPMIMYIATEKIRLAAPDSNVLFASFAVENILLTTLCSINKRIVGMLVWKSRALPSWHLIRCTDNLVAGSVLESIQMACETVKSDEITEVRPLSQASLLSNGSSDGLSEQQKLLDLFRKFPAIFIDNVKVGSAISVNEIIGNSLRNLLPSNSVEIELWLSIYQVRLINLSTGMLFAQHDMSDIKLFGTLARDKRYLGIVVGNSEKKQPMICVILRCKTLSHVVTILSYLREACQVSFHENSDNSTATLWSDRGDDAEEPMTKSEDDDDDDDEDQFALEILKSFSGQSKSNTISSPISGRKTFKERLKTLKGTLTGTFDRSSLSSSTPFSLPAESTFKSHIQGTSEGDSPATSPASKKSHLGLLSNPEEYAKFTMCYIGSATLEGVVTGSTAYDALQVIEEGGVAAGAALVPKNQISFVASAMGVTLIDPTQKMFFTRHYPKNQIEAFLRGPDKSNILGFVTKMTGFDEKFKCHLFKEVVEPLTQIYSAVEYWLKLDSETLV